MTTREEQFATVVNESENAAGQDILTTWVLFVPEDVLKLAQAATHGPPAASLEEAIEQIQQIGRTLGAAYREVAEETECGHVSELFRNLAMLEENNDRHLSMVLLGE